MTTADLLRRLAEPCATCGHPYEQHCDLSYVVYGEPRRGRCTQDVNWREVVVKGVTHVVYEHCGCFDFQPPSGAVRRGEEQVTTVPREADDAARRELRPGAGPAEDQADP